MADHRVVSHEEWLQARKRLLLKEKEFTHQRDQLSQAQRALPWERIDKEYLFDGSEGSQTLSELFDGRSQLIVYHFMFDPSWDEGCKSCSFLADHYEPAIVHLAHRDVTLVTVSRAPLDKFESFKKRMGWSFEWVSSLASDFNRDFFVTFTPQELESGEAYYNYAKGSFSVGEAPGLSVFYKDEEGVVYHTYSAYARGLEVFIGTYHLLDIVPKGRDESQLSYGMEWVRHHDRYDDDTFVDPYV